MGHVQQSTTFAKELQGAATIYFATKSDETVIATIRESGFEVKGLQDDIQIFEFLETLDPDLIIFDKIDVDEEIAKKIRSKLAARLVIFTNLTRANRYAHIAVLPRAENLLADPINRFKNLSYTDLSTKTLYFFGPKYWILRQEFFEYKRRNKVTPKKINHVLLAFGGSDPTNLTCKVLETFFEMDGAYHIDVVLGSQFSFYNEVTRILDTHGNKKINVSLHRNVKNIAELMYNADLAITAAGMTMFEALCVGTSVIIIPQDQLQRDTYTGVVRILEIDDLCHLERMIVNADFSHSSDSNIVDMDIGRGLQELVAAILINKDLASTSLKEQ